MNWIRPHVLLVISLAILLHSYKAHHVIFENVGQMAGALAYIHCKLTLNISSIEIQHQKYTSLLEQLFEQLIAHPPEFLVGPEFIYQPLKNQIEHLYYMNRRLVARHLNQTAETADQITTLRHILPEFSNSPNRMMPDRFTRTIPLNTSAESYPADSPDPHHRVPRFTPAHLLFPLGIFGTFMGLYNKAQIDSLRTQLHGTISAHNRLVEVVEDQDHHLQRLNKTMAVLMYHLDILTNHNPALTYSQLDAIEREIRERINIAVHVIQQAQHRRLAVDFLSFRQLQALYAQLKRQAHENSCSLLTSQHSDLFQLETSYFFDGQNVHLLVHVPMVPKDSLLRLFRLHPFPLPLTKEHSLMPISENNILALSSGFHRYSAEFTHTDLMGCHVVNNVYLCERHGVLSQKLNTTCLGALYHQDFEAVKLLCKLEIHRSGEIVHQLLNNWFLAYSPIAQTAPIDCRNGTSSEVYLVKGDNKFYLSPGCRAHLKDHLVSSDLSVRLDSDILHFEWRWSELSLQDLQPEDILPQLQLLHDSGIHRPTFSDLQSLKLDIRRAPGWWAHIVNFAGNLALFVLFVAIVAFLAHRIYKFRQAALASARDFAAQAVSAVSVALLPQPAARAPAKE